MYTKITISFQKQIGNFVPSMEIIPEGNVGFYPKSALHAYCV